MIANWAAVALTITAASITSANLGSRITGYGFAVFTAGSLAWLAYGLMSGQPGLVWTNVALTLLNLFGVWRWLGREARIEQGGRAAQDASEATSGEALFPVSLLGRAELVGRGGARLGTLVDGMAGCSSGRLRYLVAAAGGVGGVGETLHRIEWDGLRVEGETVHAPLGRAGLARLERLDRDDWPGR